MINHIGYAIATTDDRGIIDSWNPGAERLFRTTAEEAIGSPLASLADDEWSRAIGSMLERTIGGDPVGADIRCRLHDGAEIDIDVSLAPIAGEHSGGLSMICRDITRRIETERNHQASMAREQAARAQAEAAQTRFEFLANASEILASSLDYTTTLQSVARLAVPHIGDWCAVDMVGADGSIERLAVAHVDPEKVKWAHELHRRYPPNPDDPTGMPNVIRTGNAEFYPYIPEEVLEAAAVDDEMIEIIKEIGFASAMVVPITAYDNSPMGAITFVTTESGSGRHYEEADLVLAQDLARRAATAIENSRLYHQAQERREWLQVTLASIGDAVIATDVEGSVTFMNGVAESLTGWRESEAIGRSLTDVFIIVNEETRARVESPVDKALRDGSIVGLANHTVLISREGVEIPIEDSAAPIRDLEGEIVGVVMVFHDVTSTRGIEEERSRLMAQMGAQRQRLDTIIASIPGIVWEAWGRPDAASQRIDFVSDYVEPMLGYSVAEWLGSPNFWLTIVHPDDRERAAEEAAAIFSGEREGISQFRWVRQDGESIWVEAHSSVILDEEGAPIGMRGVTMDISQRKRAELELQHAKETAEAASSAKDRFLAMLSHELRTPLTPVLAISQLLETEPGLPEEYRPLLEIVRRNVELEANLIDDLLDLTRISRGKLQFVLAPSDIQSIIHTVVDLCAPEFAEKQLQVMVDLKAEDHIVTGDYARLQQVLWNLVKNAIKFTDRMGRIEIRSRNDGDRLLVDVIDNGIGIEPHVLPKIFNAFEQGDESINQQFGGLGLGLAISRLLVDMHGGTLEAFSEGNGKGARFTIALEVDRTQ